MVTSQVLKSAGFTKTQKSREWNTIFSSNKKINYALITNYTSFLAEVAFNIRKYEMPAVLCSRLIDLNLKKIAKLAIWITFHNFFAIWNCNYRK